jgi:hypothetical protein
MIYGAPILTFFGPVVNISAIERAGNFEQIMKHTFSLFSNFELFSREVVTKYVFFSCDL